MQNEPETINGGQDAQELAAQKHRLAHFMQMLAAVLVVGALLVGFLKLEALSLRTGKTLWIRTPAFSHGIDSPVSDGAIGSLLSGDSSTIYAVAGNDTYAYNAGNGQVLWHVKSGATGITGLAFG